MLDELFGDSPILIYISKGGVSDVRWTKTDASYSWKNWTCPGWAASTISSNEQAA
jgi:hypothetical protein